MDILPKHTDLDFYRRNHILSKSTFIKGKQCQKMLFLNKTKRERSEAVSKNTEVLFTFGKKFENDFRLKFTQGIYVAEILKHQFHLYAGFTEELLETPGIKNIFEAGVFYNDVLILADVLQQHENGSFSVYEIKYTSKITPVVLWDLALQYYVCKNKLVNLESFNVVLKGKKGKFRISNVIDLLEKQLAKIEEDVALFKQVLQQKEVPDVKIGSQCFRPYKCPFFDYCRE